MEKKCYICLPISGMEDTAIQRAEKAAEFVKTFLGLVPLTPIEINKESQDTLNNPKRPVEFFMGNDVKALIGECDSIFVCKGWEQSKGCNVEVECARQYGLDIYYEYIPSSFTISDAIKSKKKILYRMYNHACEIYGPRTKEVFDVIEQMNEFDNLITKNFEYP